MELREDAKSLNRKVDELQRANEVASNYYSLLCWKPRARCHYKLYRLLAPLYCKLRVGCGV